MSSFEAFLVERRINDVYDSLTKEEKLDLIKLYEARTSPMPAMSAGKYPIISYIKVLFPFCSWLIVTCFYVVVNSAQLSPT
jgi:hypothetical protein